MSVRRAVGDVEMMVRAEVASVTLPIESVLALRKATCCASNAPAAGGITIFADKVPVHTGPARPPGAAARCRSPARGDR